MKMDAGRLLVCLAVVCAASATPLNPRGARPVEQGTRSEKCASQKEWPFCTSDEWGAKCPSGCRLQGLMEKYDHDLLKKIDKIRTTLAQYEGHHASTDLTSKQTFESLRDKLRTDADNNNGYYNLAQILRQKITTMKMNIDIQLQRLDKLNRGVQEQVVDMKRLEVDIDIKLRSCKGSCKTHTDYQVDQESYVALDKQVNQLNKQPIHITESVQTLYVMKSLPLRDAPSNVTGHRSRDTDGPQTGEQTVDVFSEVANTYLKLEEEGSSSSSPATITKVPGTSFHSSSSGSSPSSSSSTSSNSMTEMVGRGDGDMFGGGFETTGHRSTSTSSCSHSTRTTIVHTKSGPVERTEEVVEGGPGCSGAAEGHRQILDSGLFHNIQATNTFHSGGVKGSLLADTKSGFVNPFDFGSDLGRFTAGNADDDVPDIHARSVKTVRVERQADFVGKDCLDAFQNHLNGETNGLFQIKPGGAGSAHTVEVFCRQEGLMGGWVLVQQRESGALEFNRTWAEYRGGFGSVDAQGRGELWLGNQNLHLLTNQGETLLKVELEDWEGGQTIAEYVIRVGSEEDGYPLHLSAYTGDAGDALAPTHSGMKFSTFDRDQDQWEENCAEVYRSGWWFNHCLAANLNGIYYKDGDDSRGAEEGIVWQTQRPPSSLKTTRMFLRSSAF